MLAGGVFRFYQQRVGGGTVRHHLGSQFVAKQLPAAVFLEHQVRIAASGALQGVAAFVFCTLPAPMRG